ncbi:MAG: hypothetical protein GF329_06375 [Candidatus Lokiarchaeota archaeon]|nr:hypothetical protein [Candidatus Lokiarchaeota archaeon]
MSIRFRDLVSEIAEETNFIRLDMIPYFKDYMNRHPTPLNRLKRAYKISRSKQRMTKSNVAAYLLKKGGDLIHDWLNDVFFFRRTDLTISLKRGGTSMDAIMNISYQYNEEEIETIKQIIKEYKLKEKDITVEDVSLLLLSESILCMEKVFNEVIGYKFSLMMQNDEVKKSENRIEVSIEVVTRLYS